MLELTNKATRPEYAENTPSPFYYFSDEGEPCIVAWSPDSQQMRTLVEALLDTFTPQVDILLKSRPEAEDATRDNYLRYFGSGTLEEVRNAIGQYSDYVFRTAWDMLCLRKGNSGEYLALDEYGVLYYYTESKSTMEVFETAGFTNDQHELVSDAGHWMMSWDQADEWREGFVKALRLEAV